MTTATTTTDHDSPCFCDCCAPMTIGALIDERAQTLDAALRDRLYTDGYERQLADELIAGIPVTDRARVLEHMITWDHLLPHVTAVDCILDECDQRTYAAIQAMAAILLDAIHAEDSEGRALRVIVRNGITEGQQLLEAGRRYGWDKT